MSLRPKRLHQFGLGLILGADDLDHLVEIEIDGQIAFQHFQPRRDLLQPVACERRSSTSRRWSTKACSACFRLITRGTRPLVEHIHVERDAGFQIALAEQLLHQQVGIDRAAFGREHDADIFGAFVVDVVEQRQLLLLQQFGDALDQLGLLHLIGNFGDDDLIDAARAFFLFPAGAQAKAAAARSCRPRRWRPGPRPRCRRWENPDP